MGFLRNITTNIISVPVQLYPSPVSPGLHVQLNDPSLLWHKALSLLQLWVSCAHSSISVRMLFVIVIIYYVWLSPTHFRPYGFLRNITANIISVPVQTCPSPASPSLHVQLNDPSLLWHKALSLLQLWVSCAHSSISLRMLLLLSSFTKYRCPPLFLDLTVLFGISGPT